MRPAWNTLYGSYGRDVGSYCVAVKECSRSCHDRWRRGRWWFTGLLYAWERNGHFQWNKIWRIICQFEGKIFDRQWDEIHWIFQSFERHFQVLTFRLILLHSSWTNSKNTTHINNNNSSLWQHCCVSRRSQASDAARRCVTHMRVTFKNQSPLKTTAFISTCHITLTQGQLLVFENKA